MARKLSTHSLSSLEQSRVDLPEQLQQTTGSGDDPLVLTLTVFNQVSQQVLLHAPRLPTADLPNGVDTGGDDLGTDSRVDKLSRDLADDGREHVGRRELVHRLGERDEDERDEQLVVREVLDDVRVEAEDAELVGAHDSGQELHDEDLVLERVVLVCKSQTKKRLRGQSECEEVARDESREDAPCLLMPS